MLFGGCADGGHVERRGATTDVRRLDDQRVAFPVTAAEAHIVGHVGGRRLAAIQPDDARVVDHLEVDDDLVGRLEDAHAVIVAEGQHRAGEAARDAAIPVVEVRGPVIGLAIDPARTAELLHLAAIRRHRRQAAVWRIDQQRRALADGEALDPVAHAELVGLGLVRGCVLRAVGCLLARCIFGVGQIDATALGGRALQIDAAQAVDRPAAAQVGMAPSGAGRGEMPGSANLVELRRLGLARRGRQRRARRGRRAGPKARPARCRAPSRRVPPISSAS